MPDRTITWYFALFVVALLGHGWWRFRTARSFAESWLAQHRYRTRSFRSGWLSLPRFAPKLFRDENRAFQFRAEVDDLRLGGTGVVWLRVWTDWMGLVEREPEVSWERMPVALDDGSRTAEDKWADTQHALLERVARGETTFRTSARAAADAEAFDEVVEHVMALQRRGLVTCDAPMINRRGGSQFDAVSNVALTEAGRRIVDERARAGGRR
jgi:hypothetical protein